jgi:hypothetical protein
VKATNPVILSILAKNHKAVLDSLLLKIAGVTAGEMTGLYAYFINRRMFARISGSGVGVRLPTATAAALHSSNKNVVPFHPMRRNSTREWIQINHENSRDYEKDLEIFRASIEYVSPTGHR